jgi:hypothetical protein
VLDREPRLFVYVETVSLTGAVDAATGNKLLQLDKNMEFVGLPSIDASPISPAAAVLEPRASFAQVEMFQRFYLTSFASRDVPTVLRKR